MLLGTAHITLSLQVMVIAFYQVCSVHLVRALCNVRQMCVADVKLPM